MFQRIKIKKAVLSDVREIHNLIKKYAERGLMLYRYKGQIERNIRDYLVARADGILVGCCALRVWEKSGAEIYALAVKEKLSGNGIGTKLVKSCIKEAKKLGLPFVFTLTFRAGMFERLGFKKITFGSLPRVIFSEKTVDVDKAYGKSI
jgi:amino-acid N-acetyltransferase